MQDIYPRFTKYFQLTIAMALMMMGITKPATAIDLVRQGQACSVIVIPDEAWPVVSYAANELQYHVRKSTGALLPIRIESEVTAEEHVRIYLGPCRKTTSVNIMIDKLLPNAFRIKLVEDQLFIVGHDSPGSVLDSRGIKGRLHNNQTQVGTLFGVYEFLDKHMGVRWLWPGELGEVIPWHETITVSQWDQTHRPSLLHTRLRDHVGRKEKGWSSKEVADQYFMDQAIWLRRHRFALGIDLDYGHAYEQYWERFGTSHPEFFARRPDGKRAPAGNPRHIQMCMSQPALWKQIVKDWQQQDKKSWINGAENDFHDGPDGDPACTCESCRAWDVPGNKSLSDRYAKFLLALQREGEKVDPSAIVIGYAYGRSPRPPIETKLNDRIVLAIVPDFYFPWTKGRVESLYEQWRGWTEVAGARAYLRPNWLHFGHNFPVNIARKLGEFHVFAYKHNMMGIDYDSAVASPWATQGPTFYVLSRTLERPDLTVDEIFDEYFQGFGPAATEVKNYFDYWEDITNSVTPQIYEKGWQDESIAPVIPNSPHHRFYRWAHRMFTLDVMNRGRDLLEKATLRATGDPVNKQRVAFLEMGLRNAELTLSTARSFAKYKKQGDAQPYIDALDKLDTYRASIDKYNIANMSYLRKKESLWDRALVAELLSAPGERVQLGSWKFMWDQQKTGQDLRWFSEDFNDLGWYDIDTNHSWEDQVVGENWKAKHSQNYDGLAWYRAAFSVPKADAFKRYRLVFGAVDEACEIWLNGKHVLSRPYPYRGDKDSWGKAFEVDVSKMLRYDKPNVLAVRVEDNSGAGGIWKPVWLLTQNGPIDADKNLIKGGDFENLSRANQPWATSTMGGTFAYNIDRNEVQRGKASAKIACTGPASLSDQKKFQGASWGRWYQPNISVVPGSRYRLRLWVKTSKDFSGTVVVVMSGNTKHKNAVVKTIDTRGEWKQLEINDYIAKGDTCYVYLNQYGLGTVWFDDVEMTTFP